jgi:glycosyltransferase involved in cell wall biosynthesis
MVSNNSDVVLSTVLLNWNRVDLLRNTIRSLFQTVSVAFELIVVDNASTDESIELIRDLRESGQVRHALLLGENLGGEALNLGIAKARGRYIHVSENDIEYLPGWDAELLSKFAAFSRLGQLSPFSPSYQVERGEIWVDKPASPLVRAGRTIYLAHENIGSTCMFPRDIWERGVRWKTYGSGSVRFPADGHFSADVKSLGYQVAWNDRYVAINWGHNIEEMTRRLPYYLANYRAKDWFGLEGFRARLEVNGYELIEDGGTYRIVKRSSGD